MVGEHDTCRQTDREGRVFRYSITSLRRKIAAERREAVSSTLSALAHVLARSLAWRTYSLRRRVRLLGNRWEPIRRIVVRHVARLAEELDTAQAWSALGQLHREYGDRAAAVAAWRTALERDPELVTLYERPAYALWEMGEWDQAIDLWQQQVAMSRTLARRYGISEVFDDVLGIRWAGVIGLLAQLDTVVKHRLLHKRPLERILRLAPRGITHNQCYLDYWRRYMPMIVEEPAICRALQPVAAMFEQSFWVWEAESGELRNQFDVAAELERRWEAEQRPPLLSLEQEHRKRGRAELARLGMPEDAWFVALHVRDAGYHELRNADIFSYLGAMAAVVERGGWVVRMGDASMPKLPAELPGVIDYCHSDSKSDWMDVYLWADCRFLVGTTSGPLGVPGTFGVPVVQTNWCPIGLRTWFSQDIQIPKLYWSERDDRHLTFAEALRQPVGFAFIPEALWEHGVRVVENSPAELVEVVVEMLDRLDGAAVYTAADESLQSRYQELRAPARHWTSGNVRTGRDFLRRYAHLLEDATTE